jgi:biotin carboxyl carrier protein
MKKRFDVTAGGRTRAVSVEELEGGLWRVEVDGRQRTIEPRAAGSGRITWLEGGEVVSAEVEGAGGKLTVAFRGQAVAVDVAEARPGAAATVAAARAAAAQGPLAVRAPIPGRVVKLLASVGQAVTSGQGLVVLEAMKMENEIRAPREGAVRSVAVAEGQAVETGEELVVIA